MKIILYHRQLGYIKKFPYKFYLWNFYKKIRFKKKDIFVHLLQCINKNQTNVSLQTNAQDIYSLYMSLIDRMCDINCDCIYEYVLQ